MENLVRGALDGALDWVCRPFGLTVVRVSAISSVPDGQSTQEIPVPRYRDGSSCSIPSFSDTQMRRPPAKKIARSSTVSNIEVYATPETVFDDSGDSSEGRIASEAHEPNMEISSETRPIQYTDGLDRAVTVNDGAKECIAFLLTKKTVLRLAEIAQQAKEIKKISQTYQEVSQEAAIGSGFLDYFPKMLEDATTQEEYDQLNRDLEQRKPDILRDIERKEYLESELQSQNEALSYTRALAESVFEQILLDVQLLPEGHEEYAKTLGEESSDMDVSTIPNSPREAKNLVEETSDMEASAIPNTSKVTENLGEESSYMDMSAIPSTPKEEQSFVDENHSEGLDPIEELELARQLVFELQDKFDHERDFQDQKIVEYRQLEQQGLVNFPESELDLFNVQQRAETTRALIEAEEAFEQARARARSLGLLQNEPDQESGFIDGTDDGSSVCDDLAADISGLKPASVQVWISNVAKAQNDDWVEPDVDEWDSRSVSMSDSVSVVADGKWRKRIDRWHYIEDSTRDGAFDGDAGAMGLAVLTGQLQLVR